mmetsp:Transcript_12661/g.26612  ORF Transcript_12661/g.26612 Transcript_12661/m.26612 type:complete len:274 (-) Transcript_12661:1370-2191(-)
MQVISTGDGENVTRRMKTQGDDCVIQPYHVQTHTLSFVVIVRVRFAIVPRRILRRNPRSREDKRRVIIVLLFSRKQMLHDIPRSPLAHLLGAILLRLPPHDLIHHPAGTTPPGKRLLATPLVPTAVRPSPLFQMVPPIPLSPPLPPPLLPDPLRLRIPIPNPDLIPQTSAGHDSGIGGVVFDRPGRAGVSDEFANEFPGVTAGDFDGVISVSGGEGSSVGGEGEGYGGDGVVSSGVVDVVADAAVDVGAVGRAVGGRTGGESPGVDESVSPSR